MSDLVICVPQLLGQRMPVAVSFYFGQMCEFRFRNQVFRVCCVYAPNSNPQCNQFLDDVSVSIDPSVPSVLAGDFNTVFDRSLDRRGSDPFDVFRESSCALNRLPNACSSIDIWCHVSHPKKRSNLSDKKRETVLIPVSGIPLLC